MNGLDYVTPETIFEQEVVSFCKILANTVISKNREYGNSYSDSREEFKKSHKDEKIPFLFHTNEKIKRYRNCGSSDSLLDLAGYACLELVCMEVSNVNSI